MSIKSKVPGTGTGTDTDLSRGTGTGAVIGTDAQKVPAVEIQGVQVPSQASDEVQEVLTDRRVKSPKNGVKMDEVPAGAGKVVSINQRRRKGASVGTGAGTGAEVVPAGTGAGIGRPKGAKDKQVRKKRCDNNPNTLVSEVDRGRIVQHNLELWRLGKLKDRNDVEEVHSRIETYFCICAKNNVMPTVAGFALALGVDRNTLWDWMDGRRGTIKNPEVVGILKGIYSMINAQYEELLTEGKGIPASSFFLMKNNYGYKDVQDHVVVAQYVADPDTSELAARAGLLTDGDAVQDP